MKDKPPAINQVEMSEEDIAFAERIAQKLGYVQTAYTSSSSLWGVFCLPENPATVHGECCPKCQDKPGRDGLGRICQGCGGSGWKRRPIPNGQTKGGCVIKTKEFGFMFVADLEDLQLHELAEEARLAVCD